MLHTCSWLQVMLLFCVALLLLTALLHNLSGPSGRVSPCLSSRVKVFRGPVLFKSMGPFSTNCTFGSSVKGLLYCSTEQVGSDTLTNSMGLRKEGKRQIYSIRMKDTLEIHKKHAPRNMKTSENVTVDFSLFWIWLRQITQDMLCSTWFIVINMYFNIENIKAKMSIIFWLWFSLGVFFCWMTAVLLFSFKDNL